MLPELKYQVMCHVFHCPWSYINRKLTCHPKISFLCLLQHVTLDEDISFPEEMFVK